MKAFITMDGGMFWLVPLPVVALVTLAVPVAIEMPVVALAMVAPLKLQPVPEPAMPTPGELTGVCEALLVWAWPGSVMLWL